MPARKNRPDKYDQFTANKGYLAALVEKRGAKEPRDGRAAVAAPLSNPQLATADIQTTTQALKYFITDYIQDQCKREGVTDPKIPNRIIDAWDKTLLLISLSAIEKIESGARYTAKDFEMDLSAKGREACCPEEARFADNISPSGLLYAIRSEVATHVSYLCGQSTGLTR